MNDPWIETVQQKISELELLANWAAMVGFGIVRDNCRIAIYDLKHHIDERRKRLELTNENPVVGHFEIFDSVCNRHV